MSDKNKIYLCGTMHLDLQGPERFDKVLRVIQPTVIALEAHEENVPLSVAMHEKFCSLDDEKVLEEAGKILEIDARTLNPGTTIGLARSAFYEHWLASLYARQTGAELVYLEDRKVGDLFSGEDLKQFLRDNLVRTPKEYRFITAGYYAFASETKEDNCDFVERNKKWAEKLKPLSGVVLAPIGAGHIYGPDPTLPELLAGYDVESFKLNETGKWSAA